MVSEFIVATIEQSLKLLQTDKPSADGILWAQALNTKPNLQLYNGKAETALESWQQAQKYYDLAGDTMGSLGSQINQARFTKFGILSPF